METILNKELRAAIELMVADGIIAKDTAERYFPELKESEDERIRKALVEHFKWNTQQILNEFDNKDVLAWLEKQGNKDEEILILKDQIESLLAARKVLKEVHKIELEKQGEQKTSEWRQDNVEELTEFENVMMHIGSSFFGENAGLNPNDTTCIKEQANLLLELVPKQEWSEEDKNMLQSILDEYKSMTIEKRNWLKSLRPQSTWKPSDEQMDTLKFACGGNYVNLGILESLYQDLKKLK